MNTLPYLLKLLEVLQLPDDWHALRAPPVGVFRAFRSYFRSHPMWWNPYHDGTTHVVMSPLEFMQRLAALVPRPRLHLIRFHSVLAPNARLRPEIVPSVPLNAHTPSADHAEAPPPAAPACLSWARLLKRVFEIDLEHCSHCGGPLKIIAAIEHPPVIAQILTHLGLPARAPPRAAARAFDRFQLA